MVAHTQGPEAQGRAKGGLKEALFFREQRVSGIHVSGAGDALGASSPVGRKPRRTMGDRGWADLHTHTIMSDETLSPAELVQKAREIGLGALAITDHDTLEGLLEACRVSEILGMWVIPGVEISVDGEEGRSFHLLA